MFSSIPFAGFGSTIPGLAASLILLSTSCTGSSTSEVIRTTMDGVEVVSNPEDPLPYHGLPRTMEFELIRSYPGNEEDPSYRFALSHVSVDSDGSIFIGDSPQYRILKYDHDWNYLFEMGRKGAGPGELLELAWMELTPEGIIYVSDEHNRRTTLFDSRTGNFIRHIVYPHPGFRRASLLGSERLFAIYHNWIPEREGTVMRWGVFDESFEPVTLLIDDLKPALGDVAGISRSEWLGRMDEYMPEPSLIFHVTSWGELIAGPDSEHTFSLYNSLGDEVRRIERSGPPSLLTEADKEEIIQINIRRWERYNEPAIARAAVQYLEFPEYKPTYIQVLDMDRKGFMLVTTPDNSGRLWIEVYGRDGTYLAHQPITQFNEIFQVVGDTLYVTIEDELGNAELRSYRIVYQVGEGINTREISGEEWFSGS